MEPAAPAFETRQTSGAHPRDQGNCDAEFLGPALELLQTLKAEEQILRKFSAPDLLALLPKKEYLVNELGWKLKAARESNVNSLTISDSFKALLAEINRLNTSNGVFIKRSLSYWRELQTILSPPGYSRNGGLGTSSLHPPSGMTFQREI